MSIGIVFLAISFSSRFGGSLFGSGLSSVLIMTGGRGRGGKGLKRKNDAQPGNGRTSRNKLKKTDSVVVNQHVDDSSEWINMDSQPESILTNVGSNSCSVCNHDIDVMPPADDPLDYLRCDLCDGHTHIACLGYSSVFGGPFRDLIGIFGWQCTDCRDSSRFKIRNLESSCVAFKKRGYTT